MPFCCPGPFYLRLIPIYMCPIFPATPCAGWPGLSLPVLRCIPCSGTEAFTFPRLRNNQFERTQDSGPPIQECPTDDHGTFHSLTFFFFIPKSGKQTSVLKSQQIGNKMGDIPSSAWSFTRPGRIPIPERRITSNVGYCYTGQSSAFRRVWDRMSVRQLRCIESFSIATRWRAGV